MLIIELTNKRQRGQIADYYFRVKVNNSVIAEGWVEGHNRTDGWQALVKKFAEVVTQDAERAHLDSLIALSEMGQPPTTTDAEGTSQSVESV